MLKARLLRSGAKLPHKATQQARGFDLYAAESGAIYPHDTVTVDTGIAIDFPPDICGIIHGRSGLASKSAIDVFGGVIDSDYRGPIKVVLYNGGSTTFVYNHGDRIAQLLLYRDPLMHEWFSEAEELSQTERGAAGLGSTGR